MKQIIVALVLSILLFSCEKNPDIVDTNDPPLVIAPLSLLQNLWVIDSVIIYPNSNVYGNFLFAFKPFDVQYMDFRKDGKSYSYGGHPTTYYDTIVYDLLSNNSTLLLRTIRYGVVSTKTDTAHIMRLTNNSFMFYSRNPVGEYGRFVLKR